MEVYAYKCRKCGHVHYPFRMVCRKCRANDVFEFDPVPLPRDGKLVTYTELYNPPADFEVVKLGLGIVELENGLRVTGQLKIAKPRTGMRVHGEVETVRQGDLTRQFGMVFYEAK